VKRNWGSALVLFVLCAFVATISGGAWCAAPVAPAEKIKVLVVTGGHDFEKEPFFAMFKALDGIVVETAEQKETSEAYDGDLTKYDVIVLYDMVQKITDTQKQKLVMYLGSGKGLVGLHHSLGSYQDWGDFQKIIGGKFYTAAREEDGMKHPTSGWKHDEKLKVQIADKSHPIAQGLRISEFEILDEVYNKFSVRADVKPLLTVEHPLSKKVIGWTQLCGKAPVVYIQLGHGASAFNDANYRKLLSNAIGWAAGRAPGQKAQTPPTTPARRS